MDDDLVVDMSLIDDVVPVLKAFTDLVGLELAVLGYLRRPEMRKFASILRAMSEEIMLQIVEVEGELRRRVALWDTDS